MTLSRSLLPVVLGCLIGAHLQAQVSPLRPGEGSRVAATTPSGLMAPLLDEWVKQSPIPTARNLTGVAWLTSTHGFAAGESLTLIETFDGGDE